MRQRPPRRKAGGRDALLRENRDGSVVGFHVGFWDYVTFVAISVIVAPVSALPYSFWAFPAASPSPASTPRLTRSISWVGRLPGRRALDPGVIWAFKPTNVIDVR